MEVALLSFFTSTLGKITLATDIRFVEGKITHPAYGATVLSIDAALPLRECE